jgi:hypothetical protein
MTTSSQEKMMMTGQTSKRPLTVRCLVRNAVRRYGSLQDQVGYRYQKALDRLERLEVQSEPVDIQVKRREDLLDYTRREILESVKHTGMTPSEMSNDAYDRIVREEVNLRRYLASTFSYEPDEEEDDDWYEQRQKDLEHNFLYNEYMNQLFTSTHPLPYDKFCEYVAARAVIRLITRTKHARTLIEELLPGDRAKPTQADIEQFMIKGYHQEKDPYRFLALFMTEIPGGQNLAALFLVKYRNQVQETWDRNRQQRPDKTPLPGERDWLLVEFSDPLEEAVDAYLAGATINQVSKTYGVSNRRLMKELDRRGIERTPRGGKD